MIRFLHMVRLFVWVALPLAFSSVMPAKASPDDQNQNTIVPKANGWVFAVSGSGIPDGQNTTDYVAGKDTVLAHTGRWSATIKAIVDKPARFRSITQGIRADAYRGKRIHLSGYARTNAITGHSGLWMRVDGVDRILGFDNMFRRTVKGTTDWERYSVVLDVPDTAGAIYFGVLLVGSGQIWVDDLKLEEVDPKQVASTDMEVNLNTQRDAKTIREQQRRQAQTIREQSKLRSQPVNLDFEQ